MKPKSKNNSIKIKFNMLSYIKNSLVLQIEI